MSIFKPSWNNAVSPDRVELVFENRNKSYGAFKIRTSYDKSVLRSFIIAISSIVFAFYLPSIIKALMPEEEVMKTPQKVVTVNELAAPPPMDETKPPPPPPDIKLPDLKQVKFTPPVIKPDEEVVEEVPTVEEMKDVNVGSTDVKGDSVVYEAPPVVENKVIEEEEKPYLIVEDPPSFPGGEEAMMAFIGKNITYPPLAKENGIEGRVVLSFVVGKDGSIDPGSIKVLKKLGWGCEEEAVKVVQKMPGWKPGKQNGRAVPVQFNLPIVFQLRN